MKVPKIKKKSREEIIAEYEILLKRRDQEIQELKEQNNILFNLNMKHTKKRLESVEVEDKNE